MKKSLQFGLSLILFMVVAQWANAQIVTIEPANATGWEEITLTLDANAACVPAGKASIIGSSDVRMHSAAFLYDNIDNWKVDDAWGNPGVDYDHQPKQEGFDFPKLTDQGDGIYTITFIPAEFYGVEAGATIIGITAVFNGGSWDMEAKANGEDGCANFNIDLSYTPPTPALKFKLDLTYQEELGNFNRDGGKAYVIVNDTEYEMDQLFEGIFPDARFEKLLTDVDDGITAETSYTYKFKMDDEEESIPTRDPIIAGNYQITADHFFNDEGKPVGDIKFMVDMRYAGRDTIFDPDTDFVDIAGTMNGWDGTDYHLTDDNNDTIYEILLQELPLETIYKYKYRINGSWDDDKSEFPGGGSDRYATVIKGERDAKSIFNNSIPGYVPVIFSVNMSREIANGTFVPLQNYVEVAGEMNNWGSDLNDELIDEEGNGIYITKPAAFAPITEDGDTLEYKYRVDSSWDTSELPGEGNNRSFIVVDTTGGIVNATELVWYNDIGLGINDKVARFQEVSVYPNPVGDMLYIQNETEMQEIRINNIVGQEVVRLDLDNRTFFELSTGDLERGVYILSVVGKNGQVGVAKFIKQ